MTEIISSGNLFDEEIELLLEENGGLSGLWTRNLKGEEKEERVRTLMNSGYQFNLMKDILRSMYKKAALDSERVDGPMWQDRAAFELGYKKALRDVYAIIPKTRGE
jgi:hypothetical protein